MNLELLIARRLLKGNGTKAVSVPIVRIALAGIALGVCVMLLSIFIITGFKKEITDKLSGFSSHLNVGAYGNNNSFAGDKILVNDTLFTAIGQIKGVKDEYVYITKPAILKGKDEIHGVVLRGVDSLFRGDFFRKSLKSGSWPEYRQDVTSNDIVISSSVADLLSVGTGDKITAYFVQEPPRARMFTVKGIYDTGFKEYDDMVAICDLKHLQRLNGWKANEVSGIAVELDDIGEIAIAAEAIDGVLPWNEDENFYKITTLYEMAPEIFDWLSLLNMNVWIILILIVTVAGFNMVSGLLILILDKTSLIGILKALGYRDVSLRKLFLYISIGLIGRGMLVGNCLALLLGWLQCQFRIIHLDPATYNMDTVPVNFDILYIVLLNVGVLFVSTLMLIVPTMLISRIKPIKAIRFQ